MCTRCHQWPDSTSKLSFQTSGTLGLLVIIILKQSSYPHNTPCSNVNSLSSHSNNNKGGVLVHFWMVFVVPQLKSPAVCEECVGAIFRNSIHLSMKNRSSVGYLLGLPVDIDSIVINGASVCSHVRYKCVYQCRD